MFVPCPSVGAGDGEGAFSELAGVDGMDGEDGSDAADCGDGADAPAGPDEVLSGGVDGAADGGADDELDCDGAMTGGAFADFVGGDSWPQPAEPNATLAQASASKAYLMITSMGW